MPKALFLDKLFFYHIFLVKTYLLVNLPVNRWSGKIQKLKALVLAIPISILYRGSFDSHKRSLV